MDSFRFNRPITIKLLSLPLIVSYSYLLISTSSVPSRASSLSFCNSTEADLILMVDISGSVLHEIILNRSFIRSIVDGFPIDGKNLRMGFVIFSSICKTLLTIEEGVSKEAVFEVLEKPWWPIHLTQLRNCLNKIRTVDLRQRGPTNRRSIVLLITDAYPNDMKESIKAVRQLQDEGTKFFMVVTTKEPDESEIAKYLGHENVIVAVRVNDTDDRLAAKVVSETCEKICQIYETEIVGCGWDGQGNCVKQIKLKAHNPQHTACKNFKESSKILPCPSGTCKKLCSQYKWNPYDKPCCGDNIGEQIKQTRTRPVPDHLFNAQICPRSQSLICTIKRQCKADVVQRLKAEGHQWFIMCICLIALLLAVACAAAYFRFTSRKRSVGRFQRRLAAAGVSVPIGQELDALDDKTRDVLADLPLFPRLTNTTASSTAKDHAAEQSAKAAKSKMTPRQVSTPSPSAYKFAKLSKTSKPSVSKFSKLSPAPLTSKGKLLNINAPTSTSTSKWSKKKAKNVT